jgi:hypothetical protein
MNAVRILNWRATRRSALGAFARVEFPSGIVINDIVILNGDRGPWASPPGRPIVDRDGMVAKGQNGKIRYSPLIEFSSRETRDRWSAAVIDAMRAVHPEALL